MSSTNIWNSFYCNDIVRSEKSNKKGIRIRYSKLLVCYNKKNVKTGFQLLNDGKTVYEEKYDKSIVYATIELKVTPQRDCGFDDIAKTIMMYDEVESVSLMSSGAYDLAVEVKGNDLRDVAFFVSERLATIDGILSTSTHFILKKYKEKGIFIDNEEPDERGLG